MKTLLILLGALPLVVLGALQAGATATTGYIEGGNIVTASTSGDDVNVKVRITDPGAVALRDVTVTANNPSNGTISVSVCAQNAFPKCTDDTASTHLSSGQSLTFQSGSLSGASGNLFSGASVGTVQPGLSNTRFVTFTMIRHTPAPAPAPVHHPQPQPTQPVPVMTTAAPTRHHGGANGIKQTQSGQDNVQSATQITEPPVNVTVPESTPTETAEQNTPTQSAESNPSDLGAAGAQTPLAALFITAVGAGAVALRRSRQRLIGTLLTK